MKEVEESVGCSVGWPVGAGLLLVPLAVRTVDSTEREKTGEVVGVKRNSVVEMLRVNRLEEVWDRIRDTAEKYIQRISAMQYRQWTVKKKKVLHNLLV